MVDSVSGSARLPLFAGRGVEIEYMIVGADDMAVRPLADRVLVDTDGAVTDEIEPGLQDDAVGLAWCNELAAHVIEVKNPRPIVSLDGLIAPFELSVRELARRLEPFGATLLPGAAHPFMDPETETKLWPHAYGPVYAAFDAMFGCRGHGWSNLQSAQINLSYASDDEFRRLHAAIRLVLPLLPALAAASPLLDGVVRGSRDRRLEVYATNCARLPAVTARVIPEDCEDEAQYRRDVLDPIAAAVAPFDPDGVLDPVWVNARGAIARVDRGSIEIRVIDSQETPAADLAILTATEALVRHLAVERADDLARQRAVPTDALVDLFWRAAQDAGAARLEDLGLAAALGVDGLHGARLDVVWRALIERTLPAAGGDAPRVQRHLDVILEDGCLSERVLRRVGAAPSREQLVELCRELSAALLDGAPFGLG